MSRRSEVLKPFERKKAFMEDRIEHGIELYRKGFAFLHLSDAEGKPVNGARVRVRQKTHDFRYGANLFMLGEFNSSEQNAAYETLFADAFNIATLPFYWSDLEPEAGKPRFAKDSPKRYRRPAPDLCLEYCEAKGIEPKAHCLNYAGFQPDWAKGDVSKEKRLLDKRFRELAARYSERIPSWEVTNETFWGMRIPRYSELYRQDDLIEWSFETAERYFHTNRLIINEAHIRIWNSEFFYGARSPYYMQIERALRSGRRIDSIGMQFHMFFRAEKELEATGVYYDPERIYDVLDTYAKLGRSIQVTEVTVPAYSWKAEDEAIQAEILRNLYRMWFSHPAMEAVVYWNVVDGFAAFAPQGDMTAGENYYHGGLVRYDFTPKESYRVIQELFTKTWHTDLTLDTETDELNFKGFYGIYELEIEAQGKSVRREIHLNRQCGNHFYLTI